VFKKLRTVIWVTLVKLTDAILPLVVLKLTNVFKLPISVKSPLVLLLVVLKLMLHVLPLMDVTLPLVTLPQESVSSKLRSVMIRILVLLIPVKMGNVSMSPRTVLTMTFVPLMAALMELAHLLL